MSKIRPVQCSSSRSNSRVSGQAILFSTLSEEALVRRKREKSVDTNKETALFLRYISWYSGHTPCEEQGGSGPGVGGPPSLGAESPKTYISKKEGPKEGVGVVG